ncbi:polysaccharide pyruvyl transferase family protein [Mesobacillus foraminis]|uniref:polysaccharide pyruvyl transferase family protein n=1 Tax=Mesobacillus foraminis TaxID=279826 RepID=UPI0039A37E13
MKVCTITCHDVYNHGASLQAFALMKYLMKRGHDVEIIDYKPDYLSNHYNLFYISNPKWKRNLLTKCIYLTLKIPVRLPELKRKKAFDKFKIKYLNLTSNQYKSNDDLKDKLPYANGYLCGSDQIWNTLHKNGRDPAFYLDFVPDGKIKASYAASFATDVISDEFKPLLKERIEKLDGIGIREKSGINIIEDLQIQGGVNVVDPVFLLNKCEWDELVCEEFTEKYILVYDFDNSELIQKLAMRIRKKTGFKIYSLNPNKLKYADKYFKYVGPETFVSLVKNAQFVISNSFHAAVFSIIYEKNFAIVNRKESINTRMRDLLDDLHLSDRLVNDSDKLEKVFFNVDFLECKSILNNKIKVSKDFLKKVLVQKE